MPQFVDNRPVAVRLCEDDRECVYIKGKLGTADRNRLTDALLDIDREAAAGGAGAMALRSGRYLQALLEISVVGWVAFDADGHEIPFSLEQLRLWDPDDPLLDKVYAEIARLNPTLPGHRSMQST